MALVRLNSLRDFPVFHSNISRVFDDFFPEASTKVKTGEKVWRPVVDIHETENSTFISVDLPGVKKEEIAISVEDNVMIISGERVSETEIEREEYFRRERFHGKFKREFTLPSSIDHEKIKADYQDGVLNIEIPKPEDKKPKTIAIH